MDNLWLTAIVLVVLLALSAAFSATETALTGANRIRLKNQAENGDKSASNALELIARYDDSLSGLLISNNIVNIFTASLTTYIFTRLLGGGGVGVATAVTTVFVIIFGEVLPKSYANRNSEKLIKIAAKPLKGIIFIFYPAIYRLSLIKKFLSRKDTGEEEPVVTEQELMSIIDEIEDDGVLKEEEADLVQSAIEFNDITVGDIITPRVDLSAVEINRGKEAIKQTFLDTNYSRLPVYRETIDNIVGFISQKDFFSAILRDEQFTPADLVKSCAFIPPSKRVIDIMRLFQAEKLHMAVVVDEYGGTLGIITLEDVLEQLVGEIWDEHDEPMRTLSEISPGVYEALGSATMARLYRGILDEKSPAGKEYLTVSGYIMDMLNRVPAPGDTREDGKLHYTVKRVEGNRIMKVEITPVPQTPR